MLNNVFEMRSDSFKLCGIHRRAPFEGTQSIGERARSNRSFNEIITIASSYDCNGGGNFW